MSQRTIVEFNHDLGRKIDDDPQGFVEAVREMIRAGVNDMPCDTSAALRRFGVTTSPTHHHSDDAKVTLGNRGRVYFQQNF
jgi:hypothetical protein